VMLPLSNTFMAKMTSVSDSVLNPCRLNLILPTSVQSFDSTPYNLIDI
jgi:hypothetical protein